MNAEAQQERGERVVVALDMSPQSVAALRAAAELAARLEAELEGLFIEDVDLLGLSVLPFGREVRLCTGEVRGLDVADMEHQMRAQAAAIRRQLERVAKSAMVPWTMRVSRGSVAQELRSAAMGAAVMSVGRAGRAYRPGVGSIAQSLVDEAQQPLLVSGEGAGIEYPLTVLYTGTAEADRALALGLRLAQGQSSRLRVVVWNGGDPTRDAGGLELAARHVLAAGTTEEPLLFKVARVEEREDLLSILRSVGGGTVVLPREHGGLLTQCRGSALLVP